MKDVICFAYIQRRDVRQLRRAMRRSSTRDDVACQAAAHLRQAQLAHAGPRPLLCCAHGALYVFVPASCTTGVRPAVVSRDDLSRRVVG